MKTIFWELAETCNSQNVGRVQKQSLFTCHQRLSCKTSFEIGTGTTVQKWAKSMWSAERSLFLQNNAAWPSPFGSCLPQVPPSKLCEKTTTKQNPIVLKTFQKSSRKRDRGKLASQERLRPWASASKQLIFWPYTLKIKTQKDQGIKSNQAENVHAQVGLVSGMADLFLKPDCPLRSITLVCVICEWWTVLSCGRQQSFTLLQWSLHQQTWSRSHFCARWTTGPVQSQPQTRDGRKSTREIRKVQFIPSSFQNSSAKLNKNKSASTLYYDLHTWNKHLDQMIIKIIKFVV